MQVAPTNEQNIYLQNVQEQVIFNVKSQQYHASSIQKKYICPVENCNDSFLFPSTFKIHIELHTGKQKYECNLCKKNFFSSKRLRIHKEIHGEVSPYACSSCNTTFSNRQNLTIHNRSKKHLDTVLLKTHKYTCDICQEPFTTQQQQKYHYSKLHPEYRAYPCTACDKRFVTLQVQQVHYETIHNGKKKSECKKIKAYKCDLCVETYPKLN